ncbi:hypothetical protein C2G38_2046330 [Gigaspora rosea]|uniref:Uncharacterized protein n=1 Tax=Gigaspora rosea TaxID=44941 RepID=A0A397UIQ6_9GLOM|nr:hypothetical protein C2G38_2046330 [Gigaspora rosea]
MLDDPHFIFIAFYYLSISEAALLNNETFLYIHEVDKKFIEQVQTFQEYVSEIDNSQPSIDKCIYVDDDIITFDENQQTVPISQFNKKLNNYENQILNLEGKINELENSKTKVKNKVYLKENKYNKNEIIEENFINDHFESLNEKINSLDQKIQKNVSEIHDSSQLPKEFYNNYFESIINLLNRNIQDNILEVKNQIHNQIRDEFDKEILEAFYNCFKSLEQKVKDDILEIKNQIHDQIQDEFDKKINEYVLKTSKQIYDLNIQYQRSLDLINQKNNLICKLEDEQKFIVTSLIGV